MPYLKIWVHLVWATKKREPFLTDNICQNIFAHIRENALKKDIHMDFVNGYTDHIHCLVSLNNNQTISGVVQLIKGESAFWINKNKLCRHHFTWQEEYFAVSVSESGVNRVREYIKNQEDHHKTKTFSEECNRFAEKYGFKMISDLQPSTLE